LRRIRHDRAAPDDFLAPHGEHRRDASGKRTVGIDHEELLVGFHSVHRECRLISIFDTRISAHRLAAQIGERHRLRRRRRVGDPIGEKERPLDL